MQAVSDRIIDKIKRNRISTTEVADCLDKTGALPAIYPINQGYHHVGRVFWTYAYNESNWEFHEQIQDPPSDCILLCEAFECKDRALFGSLVSKFLLLYRQVAAIVVLGYLRDGPHLIKERWPIWGLGLTPIGCFNRKNENPLDPDLISARRRQYDGSIAVCDDSGVVVIPPVSANEDFLTKLHWIEEQEDVWFDCVDRLKWNTYETVCLKKYKDSL